MDRPAHRIGAEEHGFLFAARVEQPVGENVAALGVGAKLDFVDRQECGAEVHRHGFHGADEILGVRRNDFFFAGDESGEARSLQPHHLVIDLARQKTQRQADHAGLMRQHPLYGEMRLAGVSGAEDGGDPAAGRRTLCTHREGTSVFCRWVSRQLRIL